MTRLSMIHFLFNQFNDKLIQALFLIGRIFHNIPLAPFLHFNLDTIIRFLVISCCRFLLRVRICYIPTPIVVIIGYTVDNIV